MTMQSSSLLPALQELPGGESGQRRSFRETITDVVNMDRAMYAAEFASAASFGLWTVFGSNNVDDDLTAAYEAQYPGEATSQSLQEQWQEIMERGPDSMNGFIHGLKGKVAEFNAKDSWNPTVIPMYHFILTPLTKVGTSAPSTRMESQLLSRSKPGSVTHNTMTR